MRIRRTHHLGKAEAVRKIDRFLEDLVRHPPAGARVSDAHKQWDGNGAMSFSFRVSKGFLSTSISGTLEVSDRDVVLQGTVPPLVATLVGEEKIRAVVEERMDEVLGG